MTKRQDLCLQRRSRSEQSDQRQPNQAKNISHQPRASPNSTPLTSRIEFPTMTGVTMATPQAIGSESGNSKRAPTFPDGFLRLVFAPQKKQKKLHTEKDDTVLLFSAG